jgi:hypothetical protein
MRDPELTRRTLKSVIDTLNDHHQEITLAAATLNASLLKVEASEGCPMYTNIAARNFDKLTFLLGAQTARGGRTEAEVNHLRETLPK